MKNIAKQARFLLLALVTLIWLQACSAVEGPVYFYSGKIRAQSETARLIVPAAITVLKIDAREVEVPSKNEGYYEIFMLPGAHRIDFKYELSWGDRVSGMLVKSDVVGVEGQFLAGKNYEITYPVPDGKEEAYTMTRNFKANLLEKETGRQLVALPIKELNELERKASVAYKRDERMQAKTNVAATTSSKDVTVPTDFNTDIGIAKDTAKRRPESTVKSSAAVVVPENIDADHAVREDTVKRLKFWWLMANEKERKLFKKWMQTVEAADRK